MIDLLSRCRYSIGSSIVITCAVRVALISSIIAASVVVLPLPVVPVTSTSPRSSAAIFFSTGGSASSSIGGDLNGDDAEDHADRAALLEGVAAEAAEPGHAVGEVDFVLFLEALAVAVGSTAAAMASMSSWSSRLSSEAGISGAADAHHRVAADLAVQVGGARFDRNLQQIVDVHPSVSPQNSR